MKKNRILSGLVLASALALPAFTNGCSAAGGLSPCCTEFQPGKDMATASFGGDASINGQFHAFADAAGNMSVVASGALADVTAACQAIATDMGDSPDNPGAMGKTGTAALDFWCGEAKAKISGTLTAAFAGQGSAGLALDIEPPVCSASLTATASCQGSCDASAKCDVKLNPPKCTGGTLEVSCMGDCSAMGSAGGIDCTGSCTGDCTGSCEGSATAAVDCDGKCEGTCTAGGTGSGSGIQTDGSCKGTCSGKCTLSAGAKVSCKGTCAGHCSADCKATAPNVAVKCSGKCSTDATPLSCTGGKLEGGCMVSASCQANCNASASASASCTPPVVKITVAAGAMVTASAQAQLDVLINSLEANLPKLVTVVKARGADFAGQLSATAQGGADITASGKLDVHGTACLVSMGAAALDASTDFAETLKVSIDVTTTVGMK